jgi:hypothetical protein
MRATGCAHATVLDRRSPGVSAHTFAAARSARGRSAKHGALGFAVALVIAATLSGCSRSPRATACVPGAVCAAWAPFTAEELVHAPEVCRADLAAGLARDGHLDGDAVAIAVTPWSTEPARRRVTAYSLARALVGLAREIRAPGDRVLAVLDATTLTEGCASADVADLSRELARAAAPAAADTSAGVQNTPPHAAVELFCRAGGEGERHSRRTALLWRVAATGQDGSSCGVVRADGTCSDGALVDLDVSGMRAGSRRARARAGSVDGFVWSRAGATPALRNERFALGFAAWETSGEVVLRPSADERPDRCAPLVAHLAPGATLAQMPSAPHGGDTSRPARQRSRRHATLAIAVEPAAHERRLTMSSAATRTELPIGPGAGEIRTALPDAGAATPLVLHVAPSASDAIALRSVRIIDDDVERERSRVARRDRAMHFLAERAGERAGGEDDAPDLRERPMDLAATLEDGRVLHADEEFVRVERFGSDDPSLRSGILAHPGTDEPTRLEFDVPASACPRRFTARVALAPDCRTTSDGVLFRATSGERSTTLAVGGVNGASAAQPAPIELRLDGDHDDTGDANAAEPRPARDAFPERTLVLETESGPAHDTRCDWAVWVEPMVACNDAPPSAPGDAGAVGAATTPTPRTILIPAGDGTKIETAWDEINVWKLYAFFGPMGAKARQASREPDWLVRRLPWLSHVRVLAALGGNTCRHIRPACERSERTLDHPFDPPCWEGKDGRAAAYELLHDDDPPRLDASVWGAALDDLLRGGVKPHLNLSAAPCLLTGGEHHYRDYHWNQVPVADRGGYDDLLRTFASEARRRGAGPEWRLSIVNEPNCLWIAPPPGSRADAPPEIAHIGFLGDAPTYAAHFAATASLLRDLLPGIKLHIGNFTIGGKYPLEDNLAEYLGVLAPALEHAGVPPDELSAISFSIYESPQHGLDDLPAYKFGIVDRARPPGAPFRNLPIKLDEVEIHPLVADEFRSTTGGDVDPTRWAAAWHADMLAMALDTGVRSLAPWLGRLIPDDELERPFAKYWSYALLSLATGQAIASGDTLAASTALLAPAERGGDDAPRLVALHRASDDRDGLGWIATREPKSGVTWVALWRHAHAPLTDATADTMPLLDVTIAGAPGATVGRVGAAVEALSIGPVSALGRASGAVPMDPRPWLLAPFRTTAVQSWQVPLGPKGVRVALGQESIVLLRVSPDRREEAAPQQPAGRDDAPDTEPERVPPPPAPHRSVPGLPEAT